MKLRYALCDCNSKEAAARLFRTKLIINGSFVGIFFAGLETCIIILTLIIMIRDSVPIIENDMNKAFYQTCFTDPQFTAETHRLLHEKCLQLRNESIWVTHLPKDTLNNAALMLEPYEKVKAYLDSQQTKLNLTECFTELRENYLNEVENQKNYFLILGSSINTIMILFAIIPIRRFFKLEGLWDDEKVWRLILEGLILLIIYNFGCILSCLGLFPLQEDINDLRANAMSYFVDMC